MRRSGLLRIRGYRRRMFGSRRLLLAGVASALVWVPVMAPASAEAIVEYDVTARADGVRVKVEVLNFAVVENVADVGVSTAQSRTSSSGGTGGFAGNPHPGDLVLAVPDTAEGAIGENTGQEVDVPDYPLYVSSSHPIKPEGEVEQPGYSLSSRSDESSSTARAAMGVETEQAVVGRVLASAESTADLTTGAATSAAESDVHGITINEVLQIGRIRSSATVISKPDGAVTRSSDLNILDTRVAGQRVVITSKGVEAAGQTEDLPSSAPVTDTLREAGITIRYLTEEKVGKQGILSAGIEVVVERRDPTEGSHATVVATYQFGRTFATADGGAEELQVESPVARTPSAEAGSPTPTAAVEASPPQEVPEEVAAPIPEEAGSPPAEAPPPALGEQGTEQSAARLMVRPGDLGALGIYATLVFVALAVFVGGTLVRLLGVRTRWTS